MLPTPYQGTEQPGVKRYDIGGTVVSTSPAAINLTLPEQGIYLATFSAWFGTNNDRAIAVALVKWYAYSGSSWLLATDVIGSTTLVGQATGFTLSAPTSAGVITATLSSSRGNSQVNVGANLRLLSSSADQYVV